MLVCAYKNIYPGMATHQETVWSLVDLHSFSCGKGASLLYPDKIGVHLLDNYWPCSSKLLTSSQEKLTNQKDVNVSYPYSLSNIRPHDAVYAHKGVILQNDEVIIFREEQATLQYIIELNA